MGQCQGCDCICNTPREGIFSVNVVKNKDSEYYKNQGHAYFDLLTSTNDTDANVDSKVKYSTYMIRWEWEPWLLMTGRNQGTV